MIGLSYENPDELNIIQQAERLQNNPKQDTKPDKNN